MLTIINAHGTHISFVLTKSEKSFATESLALFICSSDFQVQSVID